MISSGLCENVCGTWVETRSRAEVEWGLGKLTSDTEANRVQWLSIQRAKTPLGSLNTNISTYWKYGFSLQTMAPVCLGFYHFEVLSFAPIIWKYTFVSCNGWIRTTYRKLFLRKFFSLSYGKFRTLYLVYIVILSIFFFTFRLSIRLFSMQSLYFSSLKNAAQTISQSYSEIQCFQHKKGISKAPSAKQTIKQKTRVGAVWEEPAPG